MTSSLLSQRWLTVTSSCIQTSCESYSSEVRLGAGGWEFDINGGVDNNQEDDGNDAGEDVPEQEDVVEDVVRIFSEFCDFVVQSSCIVINQLRLQELGNVNQKRNYNRRNNEDK